VIGRIVNKVDPRPIVTLSFPVFTVVLYMRVQFTPDVDMATIMVPTVIHGAAVAYFFVPLTAIGLSGLPPERIPAASGLTNFARITAGSFGTSISTTLWEDRAALHHAQLVEHLTRGDLSTDRFLDTVMGAGLSHDKALGLLHRTVDVQSIMLAADEIFYVTALLFVVLVGLVWLTRPQRGGMAGADAGAH
jgi:DHA2 family multidrug resistance protein